MVQTPDGSIPGLFPAPRRRPDPIRDGVLGSSIVHMLAALLVIFGLPWLVRAPPPEERIVPINLVLLGSRTAGPASPELAPVPQAQAPEAAPVENRQAVPQEQSPPPAARHEGEESALPDKLATVAPAPKGVLPKAVPERKPDKETSAPRPPSPEEQLAIRLKAYAQLRQPAPPVPPAPSRQEGTGLSNMTATSAKAGPGLDATYAIKDFIRAQVERRWNLDRAAYKAGDWSVSIHIVMAPDGTVNRAEIVDDPRFPTNALFRDFARSARNAVLLSSPLIIPPGAYDIAKDIVVDFDPRQLSR
ncbi:MAG TPA: hypothetical protein VKS60_01930 [Stellaceae bacterium]|nr:hypothetical protein [Stellaceae bacterium]